MSPQGKQITGDDFKFGTGFADDFDGTITEVFFEPNPEYAAKSGSDDPMLHLVFDSPDYDQPVDAWYSLGAKMAWKAVENGKAIVSDFKPESHSFMQNCRAYNFVDKLFLVVGDGDKSKGIEFVVKRGSYMTEANFYVGLQLHMKREKFPTMGGTESESLMPQKFMGIAEVKRASTQATQPISSSIQATTPTTDFSALDAVLLKIASDGGAKTEAQLKVACVKDVTLKANSAYMKEVVSGARLKFLEGEGKLLKDASNNTYIVV